MTNKFNLWDTVKVKTTITGWTSEKEIEYE